MALFEIENLSYWYPETAAPALKNINLKIEEGELLLIAGGSGSGKSTLGRLLAGLIPDFYGGKLSGKALFRGKSLPELERRYLNTQVGMVFQDPEQQLVMTTVEAEIAFGLENLGLPQEEISRRLAEVMGFLGLTPLKQEFTANLSGGQKQKVALASVLAMNPSVLILDEPTSQLDPLAAEEFFNLVERLNKEMGYTVVLIEQRLERCFHLADRLAVMDGGRLLRSGPVKEVARWEADNSLPFLPPVTKFFAMLRAPELPLTVKEGRRELKRLCPHLPAAPARGHQRPPSFLPIPAKDKDPVVDAKGLWFTYPNGKEALKGVSLQLNRGEFAVIIGENAAGKTTLLKLLAGILKPSRGRVLVLGKDTRTAALPEMAGRIGYLPQNPNSCLFQETVEDELRFTLDNLGLEDGGAIEDVLKKLGLLQHRRSNPRDLSSGERQRVALASILVARPPLLLLDEPTRGLDIRLKRELGSCLYDLARDGLTILMVTHDTEFAAEFAARVILMHDGRIVGDGTKHDVLEDSLFYSPQMARLFRGAAEGVLTIEEGLEKVAGNGGLPTCLARRAGV
ncbi:MAG: ABC transporter ATP-binding protein [Thermacetogeniaceae bacterium]